MSPFGYLLHSQIKFAENKFPLCDHLVRSMALKYVCLKYIFYRRMIYCFGIYRFNSNWHFSFSWPWTSQNTRIFSGYRGIVLQFLSLYILDNISSCTTLLLMFQFLKKAHTYKLILSMIEQVIKQFLYKLEGAP